MERGGLSLARRTAGFILGVVGLPLLTWLLLAVDDDVSLSTDILAFLLLVVAVALVGGLLPAVPAAIGGFLLLNYYFTPPVRMFTIAERENLIALFGVPCCGCVSQYGRRRRGSPDPGGVARTS